MEAAITIKDAQGVTIGDHNRIYQYFFNNRYEALVEYLISFSDLIEERAKAFVGRDSVFADFDRFVREHDRGYFLVLGEPGIGKTALAAHLVKTHKHVHYFAEATGNVGRPDRFLKSVGAQVVARYCLPGYEAGLPSHAGDDNRWLLKILAEAAQQQLVVVVVDALDEAAQLADTVHGQNVLLLPEHLPPQVYFFVTARPVDLPLKVDTKHEHWLRGKDAENLADVRAYLNAWVSKPEVSQRLAAQCLKPAALVETLVQSSEGNFMYLHYVLDDIASGTFKDLSLEGLPRGLEGYYAHFLRSFERRDWEAWNDVYEPILGALSIAQEPLVLPQVAGFAKVEESQARQALLDLRGFLSQDLLNAQPAHYWLYHRSVRDFLLERIDVPEKRLDGKSCHQRIVDYYYQTSQGVWERAAEDEYARDYLAQHLHDSGQYDNLYRLIEDKGWYDARRVADPTRRGYVSDIEWALRAAEAQGVTGLAALAACTLAYATARSLAASIPVEALLLLAELGDAQQALQYAELIYEGEKRAQIYQQMGLQLHKSGAKSLARIALQRALATAEKIPDAEKRLATPAPILHLLAQLGLWEQLQQTISRILAATDVNDHEYQQTLCSAVEVLAHAGATDQALAIAGQLKYSQRERALGAIAQSLAKDGDFDRALDLTSDLDRLELVRTLVAIGQECAQSGNDALARTLFQRGFHEAEQLASLSDSLEALVMVAQGLVEIGDVTCAQSVIQRALAVSKSMIRSATSSHELGRFQKNKHPKESPTPLEISGVLRQLKFRSFPGCLGHLASVMAEVGDKCGLRELLTVYPELADNPMSREFVLQLASGMAQIDDREGLEQILSLSADAVLHDEIVAAAARGAASAGNFDYALQLIEQTSDVASSRAEVMVVIAQSLAEGNNFDYALEIAEWIYWNKGRAQALCAVAQNLARIGKVAQARKILQRALKVAEETKDTYKLEYISNAIACALAQVGDFERALAMAEGGHGVDEQSFIFIIEQMTMAGEVARALALTRRLNDVERIQGLCAIASVLVRGHDNARARDVLLRARAVAESLECAEDRTEVLAKIAGVWNEMGQTQRARELLQRALAMARNIRDELQSELRSDQDALGLFIAASRHVGYESRSSQALQTLCQELARAGCQTELMQVIEISEALLKDHYLLGALSAAACSLAQVGAVEQALKLAEREFEWPHDSNRIRIAVAQGMAQAGRLEEARKMMESLDSWHMKNEVLPLIAHQLAQTGALKQALAVARQVGKSIRPTSLSVIAQKLAAREQSRQAREVLEEAVSLLEKQDKFNYRREDVLNSVMQVLAEISGLQDEWALERVQSVLRSIRTWSRDIVWQYIISLVPVLTKLAGPRAVIELRDRLQTIEGLWAR